jgi:hypothetical protein
MCALCIGGWAAAPHLLVLMKTEDGHAVPSMVRKFTLPSVFYNKIWVFRLNHRFIFPDVKFKKKFDRNYNKFFCIRIFEYPNQGQTKFKKIQFQMGSQCKTHKEIIL